MASKASSYKTAMNTPKIPNLNTKTKREETATGLKKSIYSFSIKSETVVLLSSSSRDFCAAESGSCKTE